MEAVLWLKKRAFCSVWIDWNKNWSSSNGIYSDS
jgi:hypothetical protein